MTRLTGVPRFEPPALSRVKRAIGPRLQGFETHDVSIPADTNNEFAQGHPPVSAEWQSGRPDLRAFCRRRLRCIHRVDGRCGAVTITDPPAHHGHRKRPMPAPPPPGTGIFAAAGAVIGSLRRCEPIGPKNLARQACEVFNAVPQALERHQIIGGSRLTQFAVTDVYCRLIATLLSGSI